MSGRSLKVLTVLALVGGLAACASVKSTFKSSVESLGQMLQGDNPMSFFITSVNPGRGADLGGLAGADSHCRKLAAAAGAPDRIWRAYLSANPVGGASAVNARDRIGNGPWRNAKGDILAYNSAELHGSNNLNKRTALNEKGEVVPGRGDPRNDHDILTGSMPDGTAAPQTCNNWTASGEGSAIVGHHDRIGLNDLPPALSWNSSHPTRGCGLDALRSTGGGGLFYCFATN